MKSTEILGFLKQQKRDLKTRSSVTRIGLLGVLRGSPGDERDVDILVKLAMHAKEVA